MPANDAPAMKAVFCSKYGAPEDLELRELPRPVPTAGQVLVKIEATAVNDYDWAMVTGKPGIYRLLFGLSKPKHPVPGMELAGTVAARGPGAGAFQAGDAVYGDISDHGFGSFAQYVCVSEKALVRKPDSMSFEEAASLSHAVNLALQALKDAGEIKNDQQILVNGGGGGVGMLALQLAKQFGAEVVGVDTGPKLKKMTEWGYDAVVDYRQEDFTRAGRRYDLILDCKTNRSPFAYARALKPGGIYATVGGTPGRLIQHLLLGPLLSLFAGKKFRIVALKPNRDLEYVHELYAAGKLKLVIDGPYPLEKTPELVRYFGEGKHTGKIVVRPFE